MASEAVSIRFHQTQPSVLPLRDSDQYVLLSPCYQPAFFPAVFFLVLFNSRSSGSGASRSQTASASLKNTIVPSTSMKRASVQNPPFFSLICQNGSSENELHLFHHQHPVSFYVCVCLDNSSICPCIQEKALSADPYQTYSVVLFVLDHLNLNSCLILIPIITEFLYFR